MKLKSEPKNETNPENGQPANIDPAITELTAKNTELLNDLQRTRADFENYRKQVEAQRTQAYENGSEATILKLLPLLDDMDRAFKAEPDTLAPVKKSFEKTLADLKIQKITANPGTDFNPDFHDAISVEEGEGTREIIAEELRPGYLYNGHVIRATMVKVKKEN